MALGGEAGLGQQVGPPGQQQEEKQAWVVRTDLPAAPELFTAGRFRSASSTDVCASRGQAIELLEGGCLSSVCVQPIYATCHDLQTLACCNGGSGEEVGVVQAARWRPGAADIRAISAPADPHARPPCAAPSTVRCLQSSSSSS